MKGNMIKFLAGIVLFCAGIAVGVPVCRMYDKAHASAETMASGTEGTEDPAGNMDGDALSVDLQLRVRGGNLEWFDGVRWNDAGAVNELVAADPINQPSEAWQALAAQLAEARAGEYAAEQAALSRDNGSLSVDEITTANPQSAARPNASVTTQPTTPATKQPTTPATVQPTAPVSSASNDNDNDDDHNNGPDSAPEPEPAPAPEPEPAPAPEPDDTGDGENIEWSGDYE